MIKLCCLTLPEARDSIFSSEKCPNLNSNVKYMDPDSLTITYSRNSIIRWR